MKRILSASLLTLLASGALAQGGNRAATEAEKAFSAKVLAACAKALPAAPAGWEATEKPDTSAPPTVFAPEGAPIPLAVTAAWSDPKNSAPGASPAKDPKEAALLTRQAELADALSKASQKEDSAAMDRLQKELDDIESQLDKIESTREAAPKAKPAAPQDASLRVRVDVNPPPVPLPAGAKALPPVAGCPAYRLPDGGSADPGQTGAVLVFVGPWSEKKDGTAVRMEAAKRAGVPSTSVQAITVRVQAAPQRADKVAQQVDWAALKALLSK